jgi:hypothetical protein
MTDDRSLNYRVEDAPDALSFSQRGAKRQRGFYLQGGEGASSMQENPYYTPAGDTT